MKATQQDGSYPRPLLTREEWTSLDGTWDFAYDDAGEGRTARWYATGSPAFDRRIEVPYPPESPASGINDTGFHPVVWYRRTLGLSASAGRRELIHFGAVDFVADVWLDGQHVGHHVGGQTPFTVDVTDVLAPGVDEHVLVVRAEDDPFSMEAPRGKQDWRDQTHGIWYERTTGIWQTVWAESVPAAHVTEVYWRSDVPRCAVHGEIVLSQVPSGAPTVDVVVTFGDEVLASQSVGVRDAKVLVDLKLPALTNGQDRARLLWSPEHPNLIDIAVTLRSDGAVLDDVASYTGLRTVSVSGGAFKLNEAPIYTRSVLNQGYRPDTHNASTGTAQLKGEVELLLAMGFNSVRNHQKAEDPRFLFWADTLGLMVWGETAAAYSFSNTAIELLTAEWLELVRRDRSHPSVVVWVPFNESWGVQDIAHDEAQKNFAKGLSAITRALDPTRPVISNDGWEHVDSDIMGIHDYTTNGPGLLATWGTAGSADARVRSELGVQGRKPVVDPLALLKWDAGTAPLMLTEFGGISLSADPDDWGYASVTSPKEYESIVGELFDALRKSPTVVGFCYTQFMDTGQETNGLLYSDGTPKLPVETIRRIVTGTGEGVKLEAGATNGWQD
ncbi:glycoside hydrolase family 2 protein [Kineosporia succinea]|uniref:Beta-galactosidase/beta-glucuronidase n=1 Tax=Kineosporia succinea TaxID=84632 RepID=A0ABT9NY09_9ACTN|nr:sugar-binding domain-containing protein [Kineosporia succinea]MDP9825323.1 beta-galactosidase/beta-glucuronidase [Kineosporia succinea]